MQIAKTNGFAKAGAAVIAGVALTAAFMCVSAAPAMAIDAPTGGVTTYVEGDGATVSATVKGLDAEALAGSTVEWTASNDTVEILSTTQDGAKISAVVVGTDQASMLYGASATLTAKVTTPEGTVATTSMRVKVYGAAAGTTVLSGFKTQGWESNEDAALYQVIGNKGNKVIYRQCYTEGQDVAEVPNHITIYGKKYKVVSVGYVKTNGAYRSAFKSFDGTKVKIGENVLVLQPRCFANSNVKTVTLRTAKLKAATVTKCFTGSVVRNVINNSTAKNAFYEDIFEASNSGANVTVK